ncbi:2-hydroxyacid dehydrogenase [bacterium]|nr:2-hydroxyacid dehydrogenase [bacterium]
MNILFAAPENAWGEFLGLIQAKLPHHHFVATGKFKVESLKEFDVLIPTMSPITEEVIQTGDQLRLIQQCGSGIEMIDLDAAKKHRVLVANVPTDISGNADSVAELGIYLMIGLSRDVRGMANSLKNRKMGEPQGMALTGKTVGFIGLGGIAQALIRRLRVFDVKMMGIKRHNTEEAAKNLRLEWVGTPTDLHYLLQRSDFVILCLPDTTESHHLIDQSSLAKMKSSAYVINLSRGGLIDHDALGDALASGLIAGAGLDVFWEEPPDPNDAIFRYNVIATPHIAGSTDVSISGIVREVAENIRRLENGQVPLNIQN